MKHLSYTSLLRKVCKLGNLHYRFFIRHGQLFFHVFDKTPDEIKSSSHYREIRTLIYIAGPTWMIPSEISRGDFAAYFALFKTSLLKDVFGHKISSIEQLLVELELKYI